MRNTQNEYAPDGSFEHEGETIYYRILDNKPICMRDGIEKMSGYFQFSKRNGTNIGVIAFYENYEDTTPVYQSTAHKYYKKMIKK